MLLRKAFFASFLFITTLFLLKFSISPFAFTQEKPIKIFEIEIPELGLVSTSQSEVTISSTKTKQVVIHILNPQATDIDYGQIFPFINGKAAAPISQTGVDEKGKIVRINLEKLPDYSLVSGRNSVEIKATNRRGRNFYANFVLRTVTENRNQDFIYSTEIGNNLKQQIPPELFLLEPETSVELASNQKRTIKISGIATAVDSIERITVNGTPVMLKKGNQITLRSFGLANEDNRVFFDTTFSVNSFSNVIVEAIDISGNHTKLEVPVIKSQTLVAEEFRGRKYALITGISDFRYNDGIDDLNYADDDAQSIYQFLQSSSGGGFASENVTLLVNSQATLGKFKQTLTTLLSKITPEDLLVIFLATHAGPDPAMPQNLYFVFHDTQADKPAESALLMKDLESTLAQSTSLRRLVLVLDTCHSAGFISPNPGTRAFGLNLSNLYAEKLLYKEEGRAFITSSDVSEKSQEDKKWGGGHGVFSHYLLEGLKGKADSNTDKLITVGELFRFVRQKVRIDTQFRQNPKLLVGTNENISLAAVTTKQK